MGKCRLWVNVSWMWSRSSWSSSQLFNFSLGQYVNGQVLTWSTYYMVNLVHQKIDFAHNIIYNWIYPTTRPDRAHRQKQNCIYPRLFGLQIIFRKLTLHKTSSVLEYIPPPGPTGPTDKGTTAYMIYPIMFGLQIIFWKLTLHTTLSIIGYIPPPGPTGPTDMSFKTFTHDGYALFTLCLWALSGPEVGYIQL